MNWVKENKFMTGFFAVLLLGAGVLGYLLYTAYGAYSDVSDQYTQYATQLDQLQKRAPYPDAKNLAAYKAERDGLIDATHDLAASLADQVLPVPDLTPSAFQDKLRDTITTVTTKAGRLGVKLPEGFAMDFDIYQKQPPTVQAAGPLGRQLEALEIAMNILMDAHVDILAEFKRDPLPQETGRPAGAPPGGPGPGAGARMGGGGNPLVQKYPFAIKFTASQETFQKVLNDFAASNKQFFTTRTLVIENSDPKPVSKSAPADIGAQAPGAAAPPAIPGQPAPAGQPAAPAGVAPVSELRFILGTEKVNVAMRVDMVTFNPPDKAARKGGPAH